MMLKTQTVSWYSPRILLHFGLRIQLTNGVIEHLNQSNTIGVYYLIQAKSKGKILVFPDEAQLVETEAEHILLRNIHVTYMRSVRIKCNENDLNISKLDNAIEQLKK